MPKNRTHTLERMYNSVFSPLSLPEGKKIKSVFQLSSQVTAKCLLIADHYSVYKKKQNKKLIISLISALLNKKVNLQKCKYS